MGVKDSFFFRFLYLVSLLENFYYLLIIRLGKGYISLWFLSLKLFYIIGFLVVDIDDV